VLAAAGPNSAGGALLFIELGAIVLGLALLGRLAHRVGLSPIPLYLLAGLAFGDGGLLPLDVSESFVEVGAEIGVLLLLFMLGLEYTSDELRDSLRTGWPAGVVDIVCNATPGAVAGLILGWDPVEVVLLAGVTYISSSGIVAKLLADLDRLGNRETPIVLSLLVMEDLVMAVYLPGVAVLLAAAGLLSGLASLTAALLTVAVVLTLALRHGVRVSRAIASPSDEVVLLSTFGVVLLVSGLAQAFQVSAAVGAFLVGIALSGQLAVRARVLLTPLRDLFAAVFFVFFGLQVDPSGIPPVAAVAVGIGVVTALTKIATGWWAARRAGVAAPGRWRAGTALVARGEFSIVIAELSTSNELRSVTAAYVLFLAVLGPLLARAGPPLPGAARGSRRRARTDAPP
jgi:CPA2 family monovalent cation:H+ antiporter-2